MRQQLHIIPKWMICVIVTFVPAFAVHAADGTELFRIKSKLSAFAVSADGKVAAIAGDDQSVRLFDTATGKELRTIAATALALAFSPDGKLLAIGGSGVILLDVATGRRTAIIAKGQEQIRSIAFRGDGQALATGSPRGGARIWGLGSRQLAAFDLGHWGVANVALTPDGKTLIAGGHVMIHPPPPGVPLPMKFMAWDVESKKSIFSGGWPVSGGPLLISPDGKTLGVAAEGGLDLWGLAAGMLRASLRGHHDFPQAAAFSPDGKLLAIADEHGLIRIWDPAAGRPREFSRKTPWPVRGLAFGPGGRTLLSVEAAGGESIVRTWDATDDTSHYLYMPLPGECFALSVSSDGAAVFAATDAGVWRWDLKTGRELPPLKEHKFGLDGAAFSADGKTVATLDRTAELRLWNADQGKVRLNRPKTGKFAAAFNGDGSLLAVADSNLALILNAAGGKEKFVLAGHRKQIAGIAFSPDGKTIVTVSQDQYVRWWDAATGKPKAGELHGSSLACLAISGNGKLVASGAEDGTVKVWDLNTREIVANLEGHEKTVRCLAFSPDSKLLVTGSADGSCRIWDIPEQKARIVIDKAGGPFGVAFMPDGKTLLTAGATRTIQLWDPATGAEKLKP